MPAAGREEEETRVLGGSFHLGKNCSHKILIAKLKFTT